MYTRYEGDKGRRERFLRAWHLLWKKETKEKVNIMLISC